MMTSKVKTPPPLVWPLMTELRWWPGGCNEGVVTGIYILIVTFTSKLGIYTRQEIQRKITHTRQHGTKYLILRHLRIRSTFHSFISMSNHIEKRA